MQKLYEESNIQAIADAIREKNGSEDTYKVSEMAEAIEALESKDPNCNGLHIPEESLVVSGNCSYRFSHRGWDWFIEEFGDRMVTEGISSANSMFAASGIKTLPFVLNFSDGGADCKDMFSNCSLEEIPPIDFNCNSTWHCSYERLFTTSSSIKEIGALSNMRPNNMSNMFTNNTNLRYLPEFENLDMSRIYENKSASIASMFNGCNSLRCMPEDFLKKLYVPLSTSYYNSIFYSGFSSCFALDEIKGLNPQTGAMTSNMFSSTFYYCHRLKDVVFATQENGDCYEVNWKNQTIDLSSYVGYVSSSLYPYRNSGITANKEVIDDASYQALKNDSDWFTCDIAYSRYNHDSAVNTINSLPITTNTGCSIKFKGKSGSATDGGAINTLTEEEIAIATAKGWTVTLV